MILDFSSLLLGPYRLHRQMSINSKYYATHLFFSPINMHWSKLGFDQCIWSSFGAAIDHYHDS